MHACMHVIAFYVGVSKFSNCYWELEGLFNSLPSFWLLLCPSSRLLYLHAWFTYVLIGLNLSVQLSFASFSINSLGSLICFGHGTMYGTMGVWVVGFRFNRKNLARLHSREEAQISMHASKF